MTADRQAETKPVPDDGVLSPDDMDLQLPPIEERPLVTFAVFAYNQEKYIREAVEGAFSQTYQPLEIILSDDCSTDRTFEIMQEMAAVYRGPHRVRIVQQPSNLGTVNHVICVARMSTGHFFVVNAGDDISYPDRAELLVRASIETGATCVNSMHDEISESGALLRKNCRFPLSSTAQEIFFRSKISQKLNGRIQSAIGFAASYKRDFWGNLPLNEHKLLIEDGLATVLINVRGENISCVDKSLIAYRILNNSLSLRQSESNEADTLKRESKISATGKGIVCLFKYLFDKGVLDINSMEDSVLRGIRRHVNYGETVSGFWQDATLERIRRVLRARSKKSFLFMIPRLLGWRVFFKVKSLSLRISARRK